VRVSIARRLWWLSGVAPLACGGLSSGGGSGIGVLCHLDPEACLCADGACSSGGSGGSAGSTGGFVSGGGSNTGGSGGLNTGGSAGSTGGTGITYNYGDVTPCETTGNSLFLAGDANDFIHAGQDLITQAQFADASSQRHLSFTVTPTDSAQGLWWYVEFSSQQLGQDLAIGEYLDAERYPFESPATPGLSVSGDGSGCNTLSGKFTITDLAWRGSALLRATAAFEQHCEQGVAALRGCIHYDSAAQP
jgi:hypothetical protein